MYSIGIDLGTTNSLIAFYDKGKVTVLPNIHDIGRVILPSVVAIKKDKVLIGSKARELLRSGSADVFANFKRKIGTNEIFTTHDGNVILTPVNLSATILKELKSFHKNFQSSNYVVTIPASFNIAQSNATLESAKEAGLEPVLLLQEPIAASLAYANTLLNTNSFSEGRWLVYDLGGGTFDVALVSITDGEMSVVDHEGDNFLGGTDFDLLIVEKFILPVLEEKYFFKTLRKDLFDRSGRLQGILHKLMYYSEQAKIELSYQDEVEISVSDFVDDNGCSVEVEILVNRESFENEIKGSIERTLAMINEMLLRNSLSSELLNCVLFVGGSSYIPYVRRYIVESLGITEQFSIDPTTAVVIGAAYYSESKKNKSNIKAGSENSNINKEFLVKVSFRESTTDDREYFSARIDGDVDGMIYRIFRDDGGYDSGLKELSNRVFEELPLVRNSYNEFSFLIYDKKGNEVPSNVGRIGINCGFSLIGQPLSADVCIEIDDAYFPGLTKLERIFAKNTTLPVKRTFTKTLNKGLEKGKSETFVSVKILEGSSTESPHTAFIVGEILIHGNNIEKTILKGTDVEITISINESRQIKVDITFLMSDEEFTAEFIPRNKSLNIEELHEYSNNFITRIEYEFFSCEILGFVDILDDLTLIKSKARRLQGDAFVLTDEDTTDRRYQIEASLKLLDNQLYELSKKTLLYEAMVNCLDEKDATKEAITLYGAEDVQERFLRTQIREKEAFEKQNVLLINDVEKEYRRINNSIRLKDPNWVIELFDHYSSNTDFYTNKKLAETEIETGKEAIKNGEWNKVVKCLNTLWNLLPPERKGEKSKIVGFSD